MTVSREKFRERETRAQALHDFVESWVKEDDPSKIEETVHRWVGRKAEPIPA